MTTPRVQSETEKALLAIFPEDAARIEYLFGETARAAEAQQRIDREDIAALGQGRCPASLLAPFRARR